MADKAKIESLALAFNNAIHAHYPDDKVVLNEVVAAAGTIMATHIAAVADDALREEITRKAIRAMRVATALTRVIITAN